MGKVQKWIEFSILVQKHIEDYVIKQYGDDHDGRAAELTLEACRISMRRYIDRIGFGARGIEEQYRDLLKVAHYSCLAYELYKKKEKKA